MPQSQQQAQQAAQQAQQAAQQAQQAAQQAQQTAGQQQLKAEIQNAIRTARDAVQDAAQNGGAMTVQVPAPPPMSTTTSTDVPDFSNLIPARAVDIVSITGITLVCCVVGFPIARAIGRWIDRRGTSVTVPREVTARLTAIEQAVESVAVEVERISEGQRYTTRLLSEGAHGVAPDFLAAQRDAVPVSSAPGTPVGNSPPNARRS